MRVLVCGGRHYKNQDKVFDTLDAVLKKHGAITIVNGGATGADTLSSRWAQYRNQKLEEYPADWNRLKRAAGFIRNQQMLDTGIDGAVAFPGGNGTADMVKRLKAAGISVLEITDR